MGLLSFFNKKQEERDFVAEEIGELRQSINGLDLELKQTAGILEGLVTNLRKVDNRQKETSIQLDEISELLQEDTSEVRLLIDALTAIAGQLENFYLFASEDKQSSLFEQAGMMWGAARKSLEGAGITTIGGEGFPVDFLLHSPVRTDADERFPEGYVLKTLESGYVYKSEIIKRASVIVNKKNSEERGLQ